MRHNIIIGAILASFCAFSLFCSRSDVITGAGGSVLSGVDSTLTNLNGFVSINLRVTALDGLTDAFSLPYEADPAFGTTLITDSLPVGIDAIDGDTIAAHVQFRAQGRGDDALYNEDDRNEGQVRAYLHFRALDAVDSSDPIPVFRSDLNVSSVDRGDAGIVFNGDSGEPAGDARIGEIILPGAGAADSILLSDDVARELFDARLADTSASVYIAYSIVNYHGPLRVVGIPHLVLHVVRSNGSAVMDTLSRAARITAFERDAEARAGFAYSSFYTNRTAVFKIDLNGVIDSVKALETSFGVRAELLNAVIALRYQAIEESGEAGEDEGEAAGVAGLSAPNEDNGGYRPVTRNPVAFRMFALNTLLTEEADISREFGLIRERPTQPAAAGTPNMFGIKTALQDAINDRDSGGSGHIYVYLRPVARGGMMMWDKPQRIETVFILSR